MNEENEKREEGAEDLYSTLEIISTHRAERKDVPVQKSSKTAAPRKTPSPAGKERAATGASQAKKAPAARIPNPAKGSAVQAKAAATRVGAGITVPQKKSAPLQKNAKSGRESLRSGLYGAIAKVGNKMSEKQNKPKKAEGAKPEKRKAVTEDEKKQIQKSIRSTAVRALIYIAFVIGVSTVLSILAINWANDVFALVKEENIIQVEIPANATVSEVSKILGENDLIEYPFVFRMYVGYKYRKADLTFREGTYELNSTLNYDQMISTIRYKKTREIVTITIPEGYTVNEIIDLFVSKGIGTKEGYVEAINNFPYEYKFMEVLKTLPLSDQRIYRLEGYLFPDTYDFYTDSSEVAILDKMLSTFDQRFDDAYYGRCTELGLNLDQVITLASIVQGEGKLAADFYPIAGVFYNRLRNASQYPKFESDATIQYCIQEHKEDLTQQDLNIDSPYNTYLYPGLTPGAICNPGWEAIQAALYPESHDYYFFHADTDGSTLFAKTYQQHQSNIASVQRAKENGTSVD